MSTFHWWKTHMKTFLLFTFAASPAHSLELFLPFYQPLSYLKHGFFLQAFLVCLIIVFKRRHVDQRLHERTPPLSEAHCVSFLAGTDRVRRRDRTISAVERAQSLHGHYPAFSHIVSTFVAVDFSWSMVMVIEAFSFSSACPIQRCDK
jgi:hypothetical protein